MIAAAVILYGMGAFCAFMALGFTIAGLRMGSTGHKDAGGHVFVGLIVGMLFGGLSASLCVGASYFWGLA